MAEIIDNVKVGLFIKQLLKEHQMTQDHLAEKLFITKAAVSQNLNGKSAFDIQNLVKIAEIFNITLDDLVAGRRKRTGESDDAEYVKLIRKGLDKFKTYTLKDMNLATPDVYGKVFIDYLIEEKLHDWIQYLLEKDADLIQPHYHRYKQLTIQLSIYALKHDCGSPERLLIKFVEHFGELHFVSSFDQDEFFSLLNQKKHENFARILLTKKMPFERQSKFLFLPFLQKDQVPFLSSATIIETIVKLKLFPLFTLYVESYLRSSRYNQIEKTMLLLSEAGFFKALLYLFDQLPPLKANEAFLSERMEKVSYLLAKAGELDLIKQAIQKSYIQDLKRLCHYAIQQDLLHTYTMLLKDYASKLNLKKVAIALVEHKKFDVLSTFNMLFDKNILSYVLDAVDLKYVDQASLKELVKIGAQFSPVYMNAHTATKMNLLIQEK
jgi:transcriptional regulator with XRE-family HTH domain